MVHDSLCCLGLICQLEEVLSSASNAEHFVSEQSLDEEKGFDISWTVSSLTTFGALWLQELGEFLFPVAERMSFNAYNGAYRADRHGFISSFWQCVWHGRSQASPLLIGYSYVFGTSRYFLEG
jgi:hypothetical protein